MKPGQRTHCALWLVAAAALATQAMPCPAQTQPERGTLSALFENDYFFHTDRDYTNGVAFA